MYVSSLLCTYLVEVMQCSELIATQRSPKDATIFAHCRRHRDAMFSRRRLQVVSVHSDVRQVAADALELDIPSTKPNQQLVMVSEGIWCSSIKSGCTNISFQT